MVIIDQLFCHLGFVLLYYNGLKVIEMSCVQVKTNVSTSRHIVIVHLNLLSALYEICMNACWKLSHMIILHQNYSKPTPANKLTCSPIYYTVLPHLKTVALLCLLSCFNFVYFYFYFCLFVYLCSSCIFSKLHVSDHRSLNLPPYEQDKFNYDGGWGNNLPFNLSGYYCFEYRDSLKVTL